jgi:hypothetical protein
VTASKHAEVIALAAERLRHASLAMHHVPVRLGEVADWLELAAQVHAGRVPCNWCATGCCPAVDAALGLLGDPRPELVARSTTPRGGRDR